MVLSVCCSFVVWFLELPCFIFRLFKYFAYHMLYIFTNWLFLLGFKPSSSFFYKFSWSFKSVLNVE